MSYQQHNHPVSLVPGRQAVAHRVDSHQYLQQQPVDESPTYQPYRQEYAPHLERARKSDHRSHRIVHGNIYGRSFADDGMNVAKRLSGEAQASTSTSAPAPAPASVSVPTRAPAVPQPSRRARYEASGQAPSQKSARRRSRSNTHSPSRSREPSPQTPVDLQPPIHTPRAPRHHTHPASHPLTSASPRRASVPAPAPPPTSTPTPHERTAYGHILSLGYNSRKVFFNWGDVCFDKDTTRPDSIISNGFIEGGQLTNDVPPPLLKHVENPRTKLEQVKQKARGCGIGWRRGVV